MERTLPSFPVQVDVASRSSLRSRLLPGLSSLAAQVVKFMTVGVLNTLIDAGTYWVLTRWLPFFPTQLVLAKGVSYVVGMVNSFYWNRTWTFKSRSNPWRAALLFSLTHLVALGINAGVMALGLDVLALPDMVALLCATGASFVWNFALNKLVVFKI
jgi:putative flippase GtrA